MKCAPSTWAIGVCIMALVSAGCTHTQLKETTLQTASTLTDLQYQQVMNNLALVAWNGDALPSHVDITEGAVQITDHLEPGIELAWAGATPANPTASLSASREWAASWNVTPVRDPGALRRLQELYRSAKTDNAFTGGPRAATPATTRPSDRPEPGWLFTGEPPSDALYVGRYRGVSVYVTACGLGGLSKFTLLVLGAAGEPKGVRLEQFRGPALLR